MITILVLDPRPWWRRVLTFIYETLRGLRPWRNRRFQNWSEMMIAYRTLGPGPKTIRLYGHVKVPAGHHEFDGETQIIARSKAPALDPDPSAIFSLANELEGDEERVRKG